MLTPASAFEAPVMARPATSAAEMTPYRSAFFISLLLFRENPAGTPLYRNRSAKERGAIFRLITVGGVHFRGRARTLGIGRAGRDPLHPRARTGPRPRGFPCRGRRLPPR